MVTRQLLIRESRMRPQKGIGRCAAIFGRENNMATGTTLSDKFSLRGYWWLPATPDRQVTGTLSFDPDGEAELEVDGTLRELPTGILQSYFHAPVIHGHTLDDKACTLSDAHESRFQLHLPGEATSRFFFNRLFIGKQTVDPSSTRFESALVDFTDLRGWMHRDPFTEQSNLGAPDNPSLTTAYAMPPLISVDVPAIAAAIALEPTFSASWSYQRRTLAHGESIRITPRERQDASWYLNAIAKFQMLLSLFVGEPVNFLAMRLCTDVKQPPEHGGKPLREYVEFCFRQVGKKNTKELLPPEIPFPYPSLADEFPQALNNWYRKADALSTISGLFFGISVNRGVPIEFQFLTLIQALESYHRTQGMDKYVSDEEYPPIRDALIAAIPKTLAQDFRAALKSRLKYGNEHSLRKRLEMTLGLVPTKLRQEITESNLLFVEQIVQTRNYLTHRDESQKEHVLNLRGMFNASSALRLLIAVLLLCEVGLPADRLEDVMCGHEKYKNRPRIL